MHHRTDRPRTSIRLARSSLAVSTLLIIAISVALLVPQPASAVVRPPRSAQVSGTFVGQPLVLSNLVVDGNTATFDGVAGDQWSGDLTGQTTYQGHGTIDLATGAVRMVLHETFTGSVAGFGSGQLHFTEYLQSGQGNLGQVDCVVTKGTGGLSRIHGGLEFRVTSVIDPDPFGNGVSNGTYDGFLVR